MLFLMYESLYFSYNPFFVIFKLHDDRFDIFALTLPFWDALFGIGIETLLLLVLKSLVPESSMLLINEIWFSLIILLLCLFFEIVGKFDSSLSLFFSFLLFSNCQLFISEFPEFSKLLFFALFVSLVFVNPGNLILSTLINSCFHFSSSSFLLFEQLSCFIFSFSNLFVQDFFLLISYFH